MKRRNFLKLSGMVLATGALSSFNSVNAFSKIIKGSANSFSLEAIVNNSDNATALLEDFVKSGNLYNGLIKYSEYPVTGNVMGDLIYVKDNNLIDYTKSFDETSIHLQQIRRKLGLPAKLNEAVRIRFYSDSGRKAKRLYVVQKGKIINNINPYVNGSYSFTGKSGKVVLSLDNSVACITESECRHQICKKMGPIGKAGDYITCIPNELHIFAE